MSKYLSAIFITIYLFIFLQYKNEMQHTRDIVLSTLRLVFCTSIKDNYWTSYPGSHSVCMLYYISLVVQKIKSNLHKIAAHAVE